MDPEELLKGDARLAHVERRAVEVLEGKILQIDDDPLHAVVRDDHGGGNGRDDVASPMGHPSQKECLR